MYVNKIWPITKKQENRISATKVRMMRHIQNIRWEDHVTNDSIREMAKLEAISVSMRSRRL